MNRSFAAALLIASLGVSINCPTPALANPGFAACRDYLQGRVAWNAEGDRTWEPANIYRLCQGGIGIEPARCFSRLMRGDIDWGGGTNWEWRNAVDLCSASQDAHATVLCFEDRVRAGASWPNAIHSCRR